MSTTGQTSGRPWLPENLGDLRGINRSGDVVIHNLYSSARRVICDGRYFSLHGSSVVETHADSGANSVIHTSGYTFRLRSILSA